MDTARSRLRAFRQSTILAVALTGLLLLIFAPGDAQVADSDPAAAVSTTESAADDAASAEEEVQPLGEAAQEEALTAARNLWEGVVFNLPKFLVVAGILILAWLLARLLRVLIRRLFGKWERGSAVSALVMIGFWLVTLGISVSILAGDFRALVGSLGLVGLALSWALQTPIESFTGWLLNSFRGYYRVGDRIAVGDIFGDVFSIDVLTTTLWEIGGPDRPPGQVHAEQPTGRLITFPNNEILTGTVVNLTRDFPYVWDELQIPVANESDLGYALPVLEKIAVDLLGEGMRTPARQYETILKESNLVSSVPDRPQVFVSLADSWVDITIRYLVNARERRIWQSDLARLIIAELNKPEHAGKIIPAYHRRQVQFIDDGGRPRSSLWSDLSRQQG
ncbi:MAG: mechanosensitive ion channel family protein [Thermodesulfobacteriota bacterium]